MESVTADALLRARAREVLLSSGARGFVRFLPQGGALLATDAIRRSEASVLQEALCAAGFDTHVCGGLLEMSPKDALIRTLAQEYAARAECVQIEWEHSAHKAQALGARWLRAPQMEYTPAGRQLILETLRLLWRGMGRESSGLDALRARAAVMQRAGDRSGMHEAGIFLLNTEGANGATARKGRIR